MIIYLPFTANLSIPDVIVEATLIKQIGYETPLLEAVILHELGDVRVLL